MRALVRRQDANVEAGENEANARLMADRTTAGYTEQPPPAQ
ncbi:hypothetical protein [Actinomadura alba]|nr:hypothetical protein [Actinomadura alba]